MGRVPSSLENLIQTSHARYAGRRGLRLRGRDVFSEPLGGRGIGHIRVRRTEGDPLPGRNRDGGLLDGRPETMQRAGETQLLGVFEGGCDLRIAPDEGAVIASSQPSGNSEVYKRATEDVKPVCHACGDQVHGDLGVALMV
jgi:hypothetical protein